GNQENTTWQEAIQNLADDIKNSQSLLSKVIITGHTDPIGSNSYNQQLGQKRAEFVVSQLVQRGIPIYLLSAKSKGETEKLVNLENELEEQYHKRLRRVTLEKIFTK
ncbi:MAG: OmpA family protein, partial [Candidatus Kapaibacterium sp.]